MSSFNMSTGIVDVTIAYSDRDLGLAVQDHIYELETDEMSNELLHLWRELDQGNEAWWENGLGEFDAFKLGSIVREVLRYYGWSTEQDSPDRIRLDHWWGYLTRPPGASGGLGLILATQEKLFHRLAPFIEDGGRVEWEMDRDDANGGYVGHRLWCFAGSELIVKDTSSWLSD